MRRREGVALLGGAAALSGKHLRLSPPERVDH